MMPADLKLAYQPPPRRHLDLAGGWASLVCAVHCALLPIALAALPGIGLELLDNPLFDRAFAVSVALFGLVVLGSGLCAHRLRLVALLYGIAVALLCTGAFVMPAGTDAVVRGVVLAAGGSCMALAHFVNRGGIRRHGCARNLWLELAALLMPWGKSDSARAAELHRHR
jgi:hypothetical protein